MASHSDGPQAPDGEPTSGPISADEAERLAARFQPIWELDEAPAQDASVAHEAQPQDAHLDDTPPARASSGEAALALAAGPALPPKPTERHDDALPPVVIRDRLPTLPATNPRTAPTIPPARMPAVSEAQFGASADTPAELRAAVGAPTHKRGVVVAVLGIVAAVLGAALFVFSEAPPPEPTSAPSAPPIAQSPPSAVTDTPEPGVAAAAPSSSVVPIKGSRREHARVLSPAAGEGPSHGGHAGAKSVGQPIVRDTPF